MDLFGNPKVVILLAAPPFPLLEKCRQQRQAVIRRYLFVLQNVFGCLMKLFLLLLLLIGNRWLEVKKPLSVRLLEDSQLNPLHCLSQMAAVVYHSFRWQFSNHLIGSLYKFIYILFYSLGYWMKASRIFDGMTWCFHWQLNIHLKH